MATRGQQKQKKSNATLSKAELTKLEKEAEKRSEQRRKNTRAGNAGLSSRRLNRMEAEAERKSAEKRAANTKPKATTKKAPPEGSRRAAVAERRSLTGSGANLRANASDRISPPDVKGKGSMESIKAMAKKLSPAARVGARFLGPAGVAYTAFELLDMMPDSVKKSGRTGGGQMDRNKSRGTRGRGDGAAEVRARQAEKKSKDDKIEKLMREVEAEPKTTSKSPKGGEEPRTIAQAVKMGKDYFIGEDGNRKAAVTAEELEASGMSLRDYLNKKQGKTRMAKGGMVKANCGASMPPAQKSSKGNK